MQNDTDFLAGLGKAAAVLALLFVFAVAVSAVSIATRIVADPHPAFTIPPEASTVTTAPDGTHVITRKVLPEGANARK